MSEPLARVQRLLPDGRVRDALTEGRRFGRLKSRMRAPRVLGGRYLIGQVIGRGAFGVVYKATDHGSGREVAIKVLAAVDPAQEDRFQREVAALKALRQTHIVEVLDVGRGDAPGQVFLAMELLQGKTLFALYKESPLAPARAARLVSHLLSALERAHGLGIIHRDLKPGNLFVVNPGTEGEVLKILDFGLARAIDAPSLTKTGEILGTPAYMAPEQARGQRVDARTDIYGAGGCLYAALAGRAPIDGEPPLRQVVRAMAGAATPLLDVAPGVPAELAAVVATAMSPDAAARFGSAGVMRDALEAWLARRPVAGRAPRVLRGGLAVGLAIAASAGGYLAVSRIARRSVSHVVTASPALTEASTATAEPSVAPLAPLSAPSASANATVRAHAGVHPPPASSFTPCTRNEDCGYLEKCYPGGCSCIDGAMRCGNTCRSPGRTRNDCGCGSVCKANEHCGVYEHTSVCELCANGTSLCGADECVDLSSNENHCGACDHPCAANQNCYQAKCYDRVPPGGRCTGDGQCTGNFVCIDDVCKCHPDYKLCRGQCVRGACK